MSVANHQFENHTTNSTHCSDSEEEVECCICMEPITLASRAKLLPCEHNQYCLKCAFTIWEFEEENRKCALCRELITRIELPQSRVSMGARGEGV